MRSKYYIYLMVINFYFSTLILLMFLSFGIRDFYLGTQNLLKILILLSELDLSYYILFMLIYLPTNAFFMDYFVLVIDKETGKPILFRDEIKKIITEKF